MVKRLLFPKVISTLSKLFFFFIAATLILQLSNAHSSQQKEALFWEKLNGKTILCRLCPRNCPIPNGKRGFCRARKNIDGTLYTLTYGYPVAVHLDPIEKKPLFHVLPATKSLSIATAGCNLRCKFCQNWEISQADPEKVKPKYLSPQNIVDLAKISGASTIAFTYTEPTVFYEYMLDTAKLAKENGILPVMHSSGYINKEPLELLSKYIAAANIDLKGFKKEFYEATCSGKLEPVLNTLKTLKKNGVWVEITNLLIPGLNTDEEDIRNLCRWVKDNLGPETPIHFSRFFPMYKLKNLSPTPIKFLTMAKEIAESEGLYFIYIGNVPHQDGENTYCPYCKKLLIKRVGYNILENNIESGKCKYCGKEIPGIFIREKAKISNRA